MKNLIALFGVYISFCFTLLQATEQAKLERVWATVELIQAHSKVKKAKYALIQVQCGWHPDPLFYLIHVNRAQWFLNAAIAEKIMKEKAFDQSHKNAETSKS